MSSGMCKSCIHHKSCMHYKNLVGDEKFEEWKAAGLPCEDNLPIDNELSGARMEVEDDDR